jgi:hypothetical protein
MVKSRRNLTASNIFRKVKKTSMKTLPIVNKELTKIGVLAKDVAVKTTPVVKKGVSSVYGTLATGFNLGKKGLKTITKKKHYKKSKKTRRH